MLRIYSIQHWFNLTDLADLAFEEALYCSARLRRFVGIGLGREPGPEATTMLKFRRLLNSDKLGKARFAQVGQELQGQGFKINTGTIVAPPSSRRPVRPRTQTRPRTLGCIKPARASSGTSA